VLVLGACGGHQRVGVPVAQAVLALEPGDLLRVLGVGVLGAVLAQLVLPVGDGVPALRLDGGK